MFRRKKKQQPRISSVDVDASKSTRPAMFSYHAKRSQVQGERLQPDEALTSKSFARKFWSHLPTILAIFLIVAALSFNLTLTSQPKVVILGDKSKALRGDADVYQKLMQLSLEQSVFYRSKLTMDTNKLTRELKAQFPEFTNLAVIIPIVGRRPVIQVQPATGLFLLQTTKGTYLIDKDGRAILEVKDEKQIQNIPTVIDQVGIDVKVGQVVLPTQSLRFIDEILGQFSVKQIAIESMTLPARANELHVKLAGKPYIVKFNLEGDGRQQVGTFLAVQEKLNSEGTVPKEYVDVRVEEKAFYR